MSRPPHILARACTQADEVYFHRANLLLRLRALTRGCEPRWKPAQLARGALPNGAAVSLSIRAGGGWWHVGYVLRQGWTAEDLSERLQAHYAALNAGMKAAA